MKTIKPILFWIVLIIAIMSVVGVFTTASVRYQNPEASIGAGILFCGCAYLLSKYLFESDGK